MKSRSLIFARLRRLSKRRLCIAHMNYLHFNSLNLNPPQVFDGLIEEHSATHPGRRLGLTHPPPDTCSIRYSWSACQDGIRPAPASARLRRVSGKGCCNCNWHSVQPNFCRSTRRETLHDHLRRVRTGLSWCTLYCACQGIGAPSRTQELAEQYGRSGGYVGRPRWRVTAYGRCPTDFSASRSSRNAGSGCSAPIARPRRAN